MWGKQSMIGQSIHFRSKNLFNIHIKLVDNKKWMQRQTTVEYHQQMLAHWDRHLQRPIDKPENIEINQSDIDRWHPFILRMIIFNPIQLSSPTWTFLPFRIHSQIRSKVIVYNLHGLDDLLSSVVLFCYCFSDRFCHYLHNRNALNSVTLPMMNKNNRRIGWERHFRKPTRCNAAIQLNIIYYNSTGVEGFFFLLSCFFRFVGILYNLHSIANLLAWSCATIVRVCVLENTSNE